MNTPNGEPKRIKEDSADSTTALAELREHHDSQVPVHSVPGTTRRVIVFVAVLAVGLAIAFLVRHLYTTQSDKTLDTDTEASADAPPEVEVARIEYASPTHLLTLPAEAEPWY